MAPEPGGMVKYQFEIDDAKWDEWKNTVPRTKSLETRLIELIEADTEGRVRAPGGPAAEETGQQRREGATPTEPEPSPVDAVERRETGVEDALDAVDFPSGRDREECVDAVRAAYEYLQRDGPASMRDFVRDVMPEHPVGYDIPDLDPGERYRGAWWRKVVKPGLSALPDVESPPRGASEWTLSGGSDE